jgi:hypothetical protein
MPDDYYDRGMSNAFDPANPLYWHDDTCDDDGPDEGFGFPGPDFLCRICKPPLSITCSL